MGDIKIYYLTFCDFSKLFPNELEDVAIVDSEVDCNIFAVGVCDLGRALAMVLPAPNAFSVED